MNQLQFKDLSLPPSAAARYGGWVARNDIIAMLFRKRSTRVISGHNFKRSSARHVCRIVPENQDPNPRPLSRRIGHTAFSVVPSRSNRNRDQACLVKRRSVPPTYPGRAAGDSPLCIRRAWCTCWDRHLRHPPRSPSLPPSDSL